MEKVTSTYDYFVQKKDAAGLSGFSSLQKCTTAMRVLAYGCTSDAIDEYLRMSEDVVRQCVIYFVEEVISNFSEEYLRSPNVQDLGSGKIVQHDKGNMLGEVERRRSYWKLLHHMTCGFGTHLTPGSLNDINVLHRSPVFNDILEGRAPKVSYAVNGNLYNMRYYLTDGIYPAWTTFVKSISNPVLQKHKLYAQQQEGVRKDVERACRVLQARFTFIRKPSLIWDDRLMGRIMKACIIMHNMIVEDERHTYKHYDPSYFRENDNNDDDQTSGSLQQTTIRKYMANKGNVEDRRSRESLKKNLIEHIWQKIS